MTSEKEWEIKRAREYVEGGVIHEVEYNYSMTITCDLKFNMMVNCMIWDRKISGWNSTMQNQLYLGEGFKDVAGGYIDLINLLDIRLLSIHEYLFTP